ncbi:MAG: prealbumin-like fold domain-containing protein [Micrococcales bacterium]|nr:prealbumin-like fold domain-containing protein [Micrococcales bacterium]
MTATAGQDPTTGAQQVRWQITAASVAGVDPTPTTPAVLQAGYVAGGDPTGQVRVFVADPALTVGVEVCGTGADCDPAAPAGQGGWTTTALPRTTGSLLWRISATNTGNVAMTDVTVSTADGGSGPLSSCLGRVIGDVSVGATSSITCTTAAAGISTATVTVSGVFTGQGPDGQPLASRFTDAAGTVGRVPSPPGTAPLNPNATSTSTPVPSVSAPELSASASRAMPMGTAATAASLEGPSVAVTIGMTAPASGSQMSGLPFQYLVAFSCSDMQDESATCDNVQIAIPVPADSGLIGAGSPTTWAVGVNALDTTLFATAPVQLVPQDDGSNDWVITIARPLAAGEAPSLTFSVTPPSANTPNNTTWVLSATISGSNVTPVTSAPAAAATATATPMCVISNGTSTTQTYPAASTRDFIFTASMRGVAITTSSYSASPGWVFNTDDETVTATIPAGFTYVSSTGAGILNASGTVGLGAGDWDATAGTLTWKIPAGQLPQNITATITVVLPEAPGTYAMPVTASQTPLGQSLMTCAGQSTMVVTAGAVGGTIFSKNAAAPTSADGVMYSSSGHGYPSGTYVDALLPSQTTDATANFQINLRRNSATLQGVQVTDPLPCFGSGDGTSTSTPYASPVTTDPPCTDPTFLVTYVTTRTSGGNTGMGGTPSPLDNQVVTFVYTDGTPSAPITPDSSGRYYPDAGQTIATVIVTGDYSVDDSAPTKQINIVGVPSAKLPTLQDSWLKNTATVSGDNFATSTSWVGLHFYADYLSATAQPVTSTVAWTNGWTYRQQAPAPPATGAWSTNAQYFSQRRLAVVIPAGSGINVTLMQSNPATPVTTTANYDGQGDTRYVFDLTTIATGLQTATDPWVTMSGMQPGVYTYYIYTGFTGNDPTGSKAYVCTNGGGTLITDTSGIIGPVGTPRVLCEAKRTLIVTSPSAGFQVSKSVKDDTTGGNYQSSPNVVNANAGDSVSFQVQIANVTTTALTNAVVYDVLPAVGDTGVIGSQAGTSRGTTVAATLTGVAVPSGWTASYSTDPNPCRPEVGVTANCDANTFGAAQPSPLSGATAVKLTNPNLAAASVAYAVLTYQVPAASDWALGDVVFNSAGGTAAQGNVQLPPTEAPKVGFGYPACLLAWHKTEAAGGTPLAGAGFQVTGPNGFARSVVDNGAADMAAIPGTLQIQVPPGTYTISETSAPQGYALSAATLTAAFTTTGQSMDAGTIVDQPWLAVFVHKLGLSTDDQLVAMPGSTWQILADDGGDPGGPVGGVSLTPALDAAGAPVTGLWRVADLVAGTYWLSETSAPAGFSLLAAPVQFTIDPTGAVVMGTGAGTGADAVVTSAAGTGDQTPWWVISVHDVPAMSLPATGGAGDTPWWAGGVLLLTAAACVAAVHGRRQPVSRRRRTVTVVRPADDLPQARHLRS